MLIWIAGSFAACNLFLSEPKSSTSSNLLAYFSFDENANDLASHHLIGKVYGATLVKGVKNNAYFFDGIDDFIEIENSSELFNFEYKDTYSISFWIKPDKEQNDLAVHENDILSKWVINDQDTSHLQSGYPFCIRYLNNKSGNRKGRWYQANWGGYIDNCEFGNKIVSKDIFDDEKFHHLVFTQNKTNLRLYLDGNLISTIDNKTMCTTKNNAPLRIGKRGGLKYQNHFSGIIDELRFYNVVLNKDEIDQLYRLEF